MKKEYQKPILEIKAYAQFESVFTRCKQGRWCPWEEGEQIPGYSPHTQSTGS
ncbi:MAG: hypothetical protein GX796_11900 [Clostridiaceae bacterium]|jgi:hypothetical protein|nr:hypothetical protein [Clostridiaceae bacterium]